MNIEKIIDDVDIVLKKNGLGIDEYGLDGKGSMSLTIIPLISRNPKRKRYRKYGVMWVRDALSFDANKTISDFNSRLGRPKDSRYVKGLPRNDNDEYVGIYFEEPVII